ncbi:MAG TPA: glycosyltransferase family 4 protein [Polyangia bacterium]|nr:glycosyltransferase family 4 protein [Polyangia bacterium]
MSSRRSPAPEIPPAPRTIGYYDDSQGAGGTTRYLLELLEGLDRREFRPVFLAPVWRPWQRAMLERGVDVVTPEGHIAAGTGAPDTLPPTPRSSSFLASPGAAPGPAAPRRRLPVPKSVAWTAGHLRELGALVRLFRSTPLDLLHSNNAGAEIAPVAARLAGVPRVLATWHVHSDYDLDLVHQGLHYRLLEIACMRSLDRAIAVSQATKRDWIERCHLGADYAPRVAVIHNGVVMGRLARRRSRAEARAALRLPPDALVLGGVGKLAPIKGFDVLLRALPAVFERAPALHVVLAGAGPQREELLELARAGGFADRLHLVGFVAEVREVLEAIDIYVQPSRREAHPLALLEAGALGLPTVASTAGGMPETLIDGQTGLLAPVEDVEALARALITLVSDAALRERLGQAARARVSTEFSHERMVARTVALYREMLMAPAHGLRGLRRWA